MDKKLLSRFPVFFVVTVFLFFGCGGGKKEAELETQPVEPVTAVSEPEAETAKPLPAASSAEMDFEVDELDDEEVFDDAFICGC